MFIILEHTQSGHFTCFQVFVRLVVSKTDDTVFDMKKQDLSDFSLESILSTKSSGVDYWKNTSLSPSLSDGKLLIK